MPFSSLLPTNAGLEALAEVPTGATLLVTSVQAGSGYAISGDIIGNFTQLKHFVMDADSTSTNTAVLYQTTIRCNITCENAPSVFQLNEFGVFASLNNQAPFLFAYASTGAPTGDTINPGAPIVKEYVLPIVYATLQQVSTTITMTDVVGLHAATHLPSGIDPLPISSQAIGGLCPKTPNNALQVLLGSTTAAFGPLPLHGPTHVSTARDPIPVATTQATGLVPVLTGSYLDSLRGDGSWGTGFLPGFIIDYAGYAIPNGWLLCDGKAYLRSQYQALYNALGGSTSPWGQGNGSTTFNVPDLRGRVSIGAGQGAGLTNRTVGALGGEEAHTSSVAEMAAHGHGVNETPHSHGVNDPQHLHGVYDPPHNHTVNDPGHIHGVYDPPHSHGIYDPQHAHSVYDPSHQHPTYFTTNTDEGPPGSNDQRPYYGLIEWLNEDYGISSYGTQHQIWQGLAWSGPSAANIQINPAATGIGIYGSSTGVQVSRGGTGIGLTASASGTGIYKASTGIAIYTAVTGITLQSTGGSQPHNNMQPFAGVTKIIHV